jgi:hypothetical protein
MPFCFANIKIPQQAITTKRQNLPNRQLLRRHVLTLVLSFTPCQMRQPQRLQPHLLQMQPQPSPLRPHQLHPLCLLHQLKNPEHDPSLLDPVPRAFGA